MEDAISLKDPENLTKEDNDYIDNVVEIINRVFNDYILVRHLLTKNQKALSSLQMSLRVKENCDLITNMDGGMKVLALLELFGELAFVAETTQNAIKTIEGSQPKQKTIPDEDLH